jgi:hypothetical protein
MTKDEWLQKCAAQYVKAAGLDNETADEFACAAWDCALDDKGSEAAVLEERDPEDEADEDMLRWETA